jgi:hypothetical protein
MAEDRHQPEQGVDAWDQPQDHQPAIAERHHLGIGAGGAVASGGSDAPQAIEQVKTRVDDVDGKQPKCVAIEGVDGHVGVAGRGWLKQARDEPGGGDQEKHDTPDTGEALNRHACPLLAVTRP